MFEDRKSYYSTRIIEDNKEKDYLDTDINKMDFKEFKQFTVPQFCEGRLDLVSYIHYETTKLWWLIAHVNGILDPLTDLEAGMVIKIPSVSEAFTFYNKYAKAEKDTRKFRLRDIDV